jgi:hypothetical protein
MNYLESGDFTNKPENGFLGLSEAARAGCDHFTGNFSFRPMTFELWILLQHPRNGILVTGFWRFGVQILI